MQRLKRDGRIVILGCGCFGASTAYHLLRRGYTDVTILDKSPVLPAPDAASNDINRIVRSSYADKFYCELTKKAIAAWKDSTEWASDIYHESGVVVLGRPPTSEGVPSHCCIDSSDSTVIDSGVTQEESYAAAAFVNDQNLGARVRALRSDEDIRAAFPPGTIFRESPDASSSSSFQGKFCYINYDGGWANAGKGLSLMIDKVRALGGKVLAGKEATDIVVGRDGNLTVRGVVCSDGSNFEADEVVIATGSWTPSAFRSLGLQEAFIATGQCVAMIKLTPEETLRYKDCPVVLDFDTGFYIFPPNEEGLLKMAIHAPGYTNTLKNISTPRTISSNPTDGLFLPKKYIIKLREGLGEVYSEFKDRDFWTTRLCWYNDSPDADWVISKYPGIEGLSLATAGSGHAFKFLPVIGSLVADLLEGKMDEETTTKFAYGRPMTQQDTSRMGDIEELDITSLWDPSQSI